MLKCWYHYKKDNDYVAMRNRTCLEKRVFVKILFVRIFFKRGGGGGQSLTLV